MATKIFNLIIIDESGSMWCIKQQAINSVNETIQTIRAAQKRNENQEHFVSLVSFNDDVKTIHDCVAIDQVTELNDKTYQPDCCTALYDAMGLSLNALRKKVADEDKVLVTVVTDGYENASREYSGNAIKALVEELKEKGWVFAYIGANHDVEAAASSIAIENTMSFEATDAGVAEMSYSLNRCCDCWYDSIEEGKADSNKANRNFFNDFI